MTPCVDFEARVEAVEFQAAGLKRSELRGDWLLGIVSLPVLFAIAWLIQMGLSA